VEFARAGLLGARTENISEPAGVTRAMIHYYYETKEQLYRAVLERIFSNRLKETQILDLHNDARKALEEFLTSLMRQHLANPNIAPILMLEGMQNEGQFYKDLALVAIYEPLVQILERGIAEGKFRMLDPVHSAVNIVGLCVFYSCSRNNVRHLFPPKSNLLSPEMLEVHIKEAIALTMHGILLGDDACEA
jgi:AcrR family transcriptional regulator